MRVKYHHSKGGVHPIDILIDRWCVVDDIGLSWNVMDYHGLSWTIMVYHGWQFMNWESLSDQPLTNGRTWISLGGSSHGSKVGYNPSYKWINPTYPIYNWGYNPLSSRGMSHQAPIKEFCRNVFPRVHWEYKYVYPPEAMFFVGPSMGYSYWIFGWKGLVNHSWHILTYGCIHSLCKKMISI